MDKASFAGHRREEVVKRTDLEGQRRKGGWTPPAAGGEATCFTPNY